MGNSDSRWGKKVLELVELARKEINTNIRNEYKNYLNNEARISKLIIDEEVENIQEAIGKIKSVDISYLFGIFKHHDEEFESDIIEKEKGISFVSSNIEEAEKMLEKEKEHLNLNEIIEVNTYNGFEMIVTNIILRGNYTTACIKKYHKKYFYSIKGFGDLDAINLFQIIMDVDATTAKNQLCKLLKIRVKNSENLQERYEKNLKIINEIPNKYPSLKKILARGKVNHLEKLKVLINEAIDKKNNHGNDSNKQLVFSISMVYLADKVGKSSSTITPIFNTFCYLNLLQKVDVKSTDIHQKTLWRKISCFYIPSYDDDLLAIAEQRAKEMLDKKITTSGFEEDICRINFGDEVTNKIYIK